ncbi:MAG: mutM [Lacunisphaera sp.]|nr:mutM [Lacunisphaera sp.]
MPELAEVEFFRKRWSAGHGAKVLEVRLHEGKQVFRGTNTASLKKKLTGAKLLDSETAAKQMLFHFSGGCWLGIHLGMSGELRVEKPNYTPAKHDHFVLVQKQRQLVFNDPRMFGRVLFHSGKTPPAWWTRIAPPILSKEFTVAAVAQFLKRRGRAPIKAVLLMQERFPGVGNWMADEILWRAAIHPRQLAGSLTPPQIRALHRACQKVCRLALDTIAGKGKYLPSDLNVHIPKTWLFRHRWRMGGKDPLTGTKLAHATIGGRTTCWSPARQKLPRWSASSSTRFALEKRVRRTRST